MQTKRARDLRLKNAKGGDRLLISGEDQCGGNRIHRKQRIAEWVAEGRENSWCGSDSLFIGAEVVGEKERENGASLSAAREALIIVQPFDY